MRQRCDVVGPHRDLVSHIRVGLVVASIRLWSRSGGFAGFGLGQESCFAGGEDSFGSAGGGQPAGEGNGGGGFGALEGDGEQVDQGVDGERVVVAVLVEESGPAGAAEILGLQCGLDGVAQGDAGDAGGRDVVSSGKGGAADLADGEFANGRGPFEPGLDVIREVSVMVTVTEAGMVSVGPPGGPTMIRPRPGVMSMRIRTTLALPEPKCV